MYSMKPTI